MPRNLGTVLSWVGIDLKRQVRETVMTVVFVLLGTILILLALGAVLPFIWMLFASFKPFKELVNSLDLLPHVWTLDSYRQILFRVNFLAAFRNNVILSGTITLTGEGLKRGATLTAPRIGTPAGPAK